MPKKAIDGSLKVKLHELLRSIPFIAKDNMLTFGSKTTAASKMLQTFEAPYQSTAIERLEAAGAICIGKANLDAFAHGGSTENSAFGPTQNPVDPERVPGGSSGGSAAVVASGIVPFALGSDTGGSIRQPASLLAFMGSSHHSVQLVATGGRYGCSTDTIGVLGATLSDVELVMEIIAGKDQRDATTIPSPYVRDSTKLRKKDCSYPRVDGRRNGRKSKSCGRYGGETIRNTRV